MAVSPAVAATGRLRPVGLQCCGGELFQFRLHRREVATDSGVGDADAEDDAAGRVGDADGDGVTPPFPLGVGFEVAVQLLTPVVGALSHGSEGGFGRCLGLDVIMLTAVCGRWFCLLGSLRRFGADGSFAGGGGVAVCAPAAHMSRTPADGMRT